MDKINTCNTENTPAIVPVSPDNMPKFFVLNILVIAANMRENVVMRAEARTSNRVSVEGGWEQGQRH